MLAAIFIAYMAVIWLVFDKLRLIHLNLPLTLVLAAVGPIFAAFLLISMNNFHPSSADARVFQRTVQITPQITSPGRVQEIAIQANSPVKKGDVLFTIDSRPFDFEVKRLEAAVAAAEQAVPQLKSSLDQATAAYEKANAQLGLAKSEYDRQADLLRHDVIAQAAIDHAKRNLEAAEQAAAGAKAAQERARLAYESNIGDENTAVAQTKQQLAQARYNLEESTVRAPCNGYVTNVSLVPGALVSSATSVMPFVCDRDERNAGIIFATFMQGPFLHIAPGEYAEVVLPMYPGQVLPGKVVTVIDAASEGQVAASGLIPGLDNPGNARFVVRIRLDDTDLRLPAGAHGSAAIFTGNVQIAGVIRMALMRLTSWTNYLFFTA